MLPLIIEHYANTPEVDSVLEGWKYFLGWWSFHLKGGSMLAHLGQIFLADIKHGICTNLT